MAAQPDQTLDADYLAAHEQMQARAAGAALLAQGQPIGPRPEGEEQPSVGPAQGPPATSDEEAPSLLSRLGHGAASAAEDVGLGVLHGPREILQGARDSLQSAIDGASGLGQWLEKQGVPGLKYNIPGLKGYDPKQPILSVASGEELAKLHRPLEGEELPSLGEPDTVTGRAIESAAQFITSMATLGRVFGPMGTGAAGLAGGLAKLGKSSAAVFAGFEGASGNLANLIEKVPALSNPVTRFMEAKPGDNEAENRLKNALAGAGFGELQTGLFHALKMLRGGLALRTTPEIPEEPTEGGTLPTPAALRFLGDPDAPPDAPLASFGEQAKAEAAEQATAALTPEQVRAMAQPAAPGELAGPRVPGATEALAKEPGVYINFARIDTPDDVKRTLSQLADAQKDNIDAARRGVQTFESTKLGADFTDAWDTLMSRRVGQPLNAEEQLAGRQLLAQSATKSEALTRMTLEDPSTENLFAWRKQMQTHAMIQAQVSGSQAELGRALGAMRIPVSGQSAIDRMALIHEQLDQMGGVRSNLDFLKATQSLMESGKLLELGDVAQKTLYARTRDGLLTGWTNGLLTNPLTHVKVNLSNAATIALRLAETKTAEALDQATDYRGVAAGETAQVTAGLISGLRDAWRYAAKLGDLDVEKPGDNPLADAREAFRTGHYAVGEMGSVDWMQSGQGASDALAISDSGWLGRATGLLSQLVTSPGRALAGEHEFYRSIGMRMELNRFAYRKAIGELQSGQITEADLPQRVAQIIEAQPKSVTTAAIDGMKYQTFTDAPGRLAETLGNLREQFPLVRVILPFYKIPSRILSFGFERTPFAPLMSSWRADVAAGGARQSLALAKTGLGSAAMLLTSDLALSGRITGNGPTDRGQRQALTDTGWLPYSAQLPSGRWIQYNRLEPVGSIIGMSADLTEAIRDYHTAVNADDPNVEKLTAAGIATIANNITSKTYLEGLARFFDVISDPRSSAESAVKSFAGSLVPAGVGAVARLSDPYVRATYGMIDALRARTPGVSRGLPPLLNLWGEPVRSGSGLGLPYDAFVPFASRRPSDEPIDREILKQGFHFTSPSARASFGRGALVDLRNDPALYARYQELAGNGLKSPAWGAGAKDLLNAIVSGQHPLSPVYQMHTDGPDGGKYVMLRGLLEQYRKDARAQLVQESPALADLIDKAQQRHAQLSAVNVQ